MQVGCRQAALLWWLLIWATFEWLCFSRDISRGVLQFDIITTIKSTSQRLKRRSCASSSFVPCPVGC